MRLFGGVDGRDSEKASARVPRVSSGWAHLLKSMRDEEGQRVLDIGPTSPNNINFLTGQGHSLYMANIVGESGDAKWARKDEKPFPIQAFIAENLSFGGRRFDTILLWDAADYLEPDLRSAVVSTLYDALEPGGRLLGFFHTKPENEWQRFHLRDDGQIDTQYLGERAVHGVLNNRQIEQLFSRFGSYKFFLAKDNLREVVVTR